VKIAIVQTKGGVGKTTIAVNLAVERSRQGRNVLLVDADEQATATGFTSQRAETLGDPGYTAIKLSGADVRTQVLRMAGNYQDIVIDVGGRDTPALRAALTIADVALIPFQPRSFDIWTLGTINELVADSRIYNENLRALAIINFADPQGPNNQEAAEALSDVPGIEFLDSPIGRRIAFPNASSSGLAVTELKRQDVKANAELVALINAIFPKE
jgi:chromosome partitioning protein